MTSAANAYELKTCTICHRRYMSWGAHAEECAGPRQVIAPSPVRESCDCNTGGYHEPDCELVVDEADDAA